MRGCCRCATHVLGVDRQCAPLVEGVADGIRHRTLGQHLHLCPIEPCAERCELRLALLLACREELSSSRLALLCRCCNLDRTLDGVERADAIKGLGDQLRILGLRYDELATHLSPARDLGRNFGDEELVVALAGVRLQKAREVAELALGAFLAAARSEVVPDVIVVVGVNAEATLRWLAVLVGRDCHRCVVGVHDTLGEDLTAKLAADRSEQLRAPCRRTLQNAARQVESLAGVLLLHAVVGHVHAELIVDDISKEARAQQTLLDHAARAWCGACGTATLLAAALVPGDLVHQRQLDANQFAGDVLTKLLHLAAALAAKTIGRQFAGRADPGQVRWQLLAALTRTASRLRGSDSDRAVGAGLLGNAPGFSDQLSQPQVLLPQRRFAVRQLAAAALLRAAAARDESKHIDVELACADVLGLRRDLYVAGSDRGSRICRFCNFVVQPEAIAVPLQQLHSIAASVEEHKQVPVEWIVAKRVADHGEDLVVRLAQVDGVARDEDPDAQRETRHDRSAATRSRSQAMSVPTRASTATLLSRRTTTSLSTRPSATTTSTKARSQPRSAPPTCRNRQLRHNSAPNGMPLSSDSCRKLWPSRSLRTNSAAISFRRRIAAESRLANRLPGLLHATVTT